MAKGHKKADFHDEVLSREHVLVHDAARPAFDFFQRHVLNPHIDCPNFGYRPPLLEFAKTRKGRFLIAGFDELALLPDTGKMKCLVSEIESLTTEGITQTAWQHVACFIRLHPVRPAGLAEQARRLVDSYPADMIPMTMPPDPKQSHSRKLSKSSLIRRFGLSWNSISKHAVSRHGGVRLPSFDSDITTREKKDE